MKESEKKKMKQQLHISNDRGPTFVGIRGSVFDSKKKSKKQIRRNNRDICRKEEF